MATKDPLYQAVEASIAPSMGVALLPLPTGSGKSHNIAAILSDRIIKGDCRPTFILSPQIKLLDDIAGKINAACSKAGIPDAALTVRSINLQWRDFFCDDAKVMQLQAKLKKAAESQKKLEEHLAIMESLRQAYKGYASIAHDARSKSSMEENDKLKEQRTAFAKYLRKVFLAEFHATWANYAERCEQATSKYPFLAELFPELTFHQHKVVGITIAKFHKAVTSGLLFGETMPYWHHIPSSSLIIIDESDLSKEAAINDLIDDTIKNFKDIDKWRLAYKLCHDMDELEGYFHQDEDESLRLWRDALKPKLQKAIKRFSNDFAINKKIDGSKLDTVGLGGAIYHDRDSIYTSSNKMTHVCIGDPKLATDFLCSNQIQSPDCFPLTYADARLNIFFAEFMGAIDKEVEAYIDRSEEIDRRRNEAAGRSEPGRISEYTALCQILGYFGFSDGEMEFLAAHRGQGKYYVPSNLAPDHVQNTNSLYFKGITITQVGTIHGNRRKCKLSSIRLRTFPENILLELVKDKECMVLLSSATADINDPIHNYDLGYLRDELGELWHGTSLISPQDKKQLREYLDKYNAHPQVEFGIWETASKKHASYREELLQYMGNGPALTEAEAFIANHEYMRGPLVNLVRFYSEFLDNPDSHAGLYVTPYIWPRKYKSRPSHDDKLGEEALLKIFAAVWKHKKGGTLEYPERDKGTESVYSSLCVAFLSGDSFVNDLKHVTSLLSKNNNAKKLCFICYGSGTVGVNYEYDVQAINDAFCQGERKRGKKCNFDTIYLEHPTNFVVGDDDDPSSYEKAAIYISLLEEAAHISVSDKERFVRHLLRRKMELNQGSKEEIPYNRFIPMVKKSVHNTKAYREFCISRILQALGRITRTPISRGKIRVVVDEKCAQAIGSTRMPEASTWLYRAIREKCDAGWDEKEDNKRDKAIRFERIQHDLDKTITDLVRLSIRAIGENTDQQEKDRVLAAREKVAQMQEAALAAPVRDSLEGLAPDIAALYNDTQEFESQHHPAESVHLRQLMMNPHVSKCFDDRGYAVSTRQGRYWLNPAAVQQLYVGRVGEMVLYALLQAEGIELEPLPQHLHEAADWTYRQRVFIDVKYWSDNPKNAESDPSNWCRKIERCGGFYILVNVPLTKNADWLKQHHLPAPGFPAVINGLIDIRTGKVNQANLRDLANLIKKHSI